MDEERKAESLSRYLDALLRGEENASTAAVDEEIEALGELGQSLTKVEFKPRPAHQATVKRLLKKHRPTLQTGGAKMSRTIWGIPLRWVLVLIALLGSVIVIVGFALVVLAILVVAIVVFPASPTATVTPSPVATLTPSPTTTVTMTATVTITTTVTLTPTATATPIPTPMAAPPAGGDKVTICHKPNSKNPRTITISRSALQAHLDHGDTIGPCK